MPPETALPTPVALPPLTITSPIAVPRSPTRVAGFRSSMGVLEAIRRQGRCYSDGEVLISFAELCAIDSKVSRWLDGLRAEGLVTYGGDRLIAGKDDEVIITAPTKDARRFQGAVTHTPRGAPAVAVDVDPGTNDYVIITGRAPTGVGITFLRGNANPTLYLDSFLETVAASLAEGGYLELKCVASGKVRVDSVGEGGTVYLWGESRTGFGRTDHAAAAALFETHLGDKFASELRPPPDLVEQEAAAVKLQAARRGSNARKQQSHTQSSPPATAEAERSAPVPDAASQLAAEMMEAEANTEAELAPSQPTNPLAAIGNAAKAFGGAWKGLGDKLNAKKEEVKQSDRETKENDPWGSVLKGLGGAFKGFGDALKGGDKRQAPMEARNL